MSPPDETDGPSPPAPPRITLRPIGEVDLPFLERVYGSTREPELAMTDWSAERKAEFVHQQFAAQHAYYQQHYDTSAFAVVEADGVPVGRLYVDEWDDELRLVDVALLPEARGRGIGSRLLSDLQATATRLGKPLRIHVERFSPALSLYHRLGFGLVEDRGVYLFLEWRPMR
jgi:GNAT superfamily N-acetyltransferase